MKTYEVEFYVHERRTVLKTANTPEEAKKAVLEGEYHFHEPHECTTLRGGIRIIGEELFPDESEEDEPFPDDPLPDDHYGHYDHEPLQEEEEPNVYSGTYSED
jgi:hypothetical protein